MLSDREDDGRPALGRFHSSCPERAPSQLTVGEISPTGTAQALPPTGRTLNIGEQECHDPRRPAPRGHSHRMSHNAHVNRSIATDFRDSRKSSVSPTITSALSHE